MSAGFENNKVIQTLHSCLQVDFLDLHVLNGIVTQGCTIHNIDVWVESFTLQFLSDVREFGDYKNHYGDDVVSNLMVLW